MNKPTALFAVAVVASLATAPVLAQGSVAASPALVMLKGNVGESATQTLTISNSTEGPMAFEMVAKDIVIQDGKRVWIDAGALPGSIAATAVFSQKTVVVPAGETSRVDLHVTIPPKPASRAVVVLFQGTTKVAAGPASLTASLGIVLMFTLSENVAMDATPLIVQPPTVSTNLSVAQSCVNSGTEPVDPKAMLAIVTTAGQLVGRTSVKSRRLLPGEKSEIKAEYAGDLAPGRYRALMTYDLGGKVITSSADFHVR